MAIRDNVRRLMENRGGMSQRELAHAAGISQSAVGFLLRYRDSEDRHPTTSTIEAIAAVFRLAAWQLLLPDLPIEIVKSPRFAKLVENYVAAPDAGRRSVERIAEGEVRYSIAEGKLRTDAPRRESQRG